MGYSMKNDGNDQGNQNSHNYADQLNQLQYQNEAAHQFSQNYGQPQSFESYEQNFYGQGQAPYGAGPSGPNYGYNPDSQAVRTNAMPFNTGIRNGYRNAYDDVPVPAASSDRVNSILANSFLYMFFALLLTAVASMMFYNSGALLDMIRSSGTAVIWIAFIIEIAIVFGSMAAIKANNVGLTAGLYIMYCIVNAFTLSIIFYVYTSSSIYTTFFLCAFVFGIMAVFGMITKSDLTTVGRLCMFGLFGIIIASVVNIFVGGDTMDMFISWIGIVVFLGLTAYDTQKIKKMAAANTNLSPAIISMYGAFELYLDFINLFLKLLRLFGKRN